MKLKLGVIGTGWISRAFIDAALSTKHYHFSAIIRAIWQVVSLSLKIFIMWMSLKIWLSLSDLTWM